MAIDQRRRRIAEVIEGRSEHLASAYRRAVEEVNRQPQDSDRAARVLVICHCMREVMNGLPEAMADEFIDRPKPSSHSLLAKLPALQSLHAGFDLDADLDLVPVPKQLAGAISSMIAAYVREQGRNRSNTAALVNGGNDPEHPAVKQWMDAYRFFVGWAHFDRNFADHLPLPSDDRITAAMRVVEDLVEVRAAEFFDNVRTIEELLRGINKVTEEEE